MNKELIESLRLSNPKGAFGKDMHKAADALEAADRRIERLEPVYEAALLHVGQFTPYALHTLDLRNALAAVQRIEELEAALNDIRLHEMANGGRATIIVMIDKALAAEKKE